MIGTRIGNYVVTALLGEGGMGSVYLARNFSIEREVAIKILPEELSQRTDNVERFIAEAKVVASIDHPNIIDIYDFGQTADGRFYYVMEALKGYDLSRVLDEGRLTAEQLLPYVEQLCAALAVVHSRGVIHRDLKPTNIFITERTPLRLKVLDFGLAKAFEQDQQEGASKLTQTGVILGTPVAMAPEQAAGEAQRYGPRTDLYAVGVVLYWMLAGKPPFDHEAPAVLVAHHVMRPPPPLQLVAPDVPAAVAELVERCLEKEPEDRPESASALAAAFKAAVAKGQAGRSARTAEGHASSRSKLASTDEAFAPTTAASAEALAAAADGSLAPTVASAASPASAAPRTERGIRRQRPKTAEPRCTTMELADSSDATGAAADDDGHLIERLTRSLAKPSRDRGHDAHRAALVLATALAVAIAAAVVLWVT